MCRHRFPCRCPNCSTTSRQSRFGHQLLKYVVAELFANQRQGCALFYSRASELMSLPVLGVSGWLKSSCALEVLGNSGHMEASSSAMKVDCEGDVVSDSGNCRNDGSDETPKLFMISTSRHENSIQNEPEKIYFHFFSLAFQFCVFHIQNISQLISISTN